MSDFSEEPIRDAPITIEEAAKRLNENNNKLQANNKQARIHAGRQGFRKREREDGEAMGLAATPEPK